MHDRGLVSLTQFQQRSASYQNTVAKNVGREQNITDQTKKLSIHRLEKCGCQEYTEKIQQNRRWSLQTLGQIGGNSGKITKLKSNYQL